MRCCARRPEVRGAAPAARMCHTAAHVAPPPGSRLGARVAGALGALGREPGSGAVLCMFGGCSEFGEALGGDRLEVRPAWHAFVRVGCMIGMCT